MVQFRRIHHIGVAVQELESVEALVQSLLGVASERGVPPPHSDLTFGILQTGGCELELLQPSSPHSVVGRFLQRHGEGMHHVAFEVDDVRAAMDHARSLGLHLLSDEPLRGVNGTWVAFVHPKDAHGVLIEFVELPSDGASS